MTNQLAPSVVLASGSPRRRSFLADLGVEFEVIAADIDETPRSGENPSAYVERLSCEKAFHVGRLISSPNVGVDSSKLSLVIAADTTVTFEGEILGKPEDHETNAAMLRLLSERTHHVLSGVAVVVANAVEHTVATCVVTTEVRFRTLTEDDISWYLATGEGLDKAGGYAIQGRAAAFVERVNGSVSNVVGLPLSELLDLLHRVGHPIETLRPRY